MLSKKWKGNYSLCVRGALSNNGNLFVSRSVYSQRKSIYICLLNCKLQNISFGCDLGKLLLNIMAESQKEERLKPPRCSLVKLRALARCVYDNSGHYSPDVPTRGPVKERHSATFLRSVISAPPAHTTRSLHQSGATLPNMIPACCALLRFRAAD